MTLSQFLRDYLYIPLGGNRRGRGAALCQPDDHDAARRPLAWRGLDLRGLGRAARRLSLHQSRLESISARRSRRASRRRRSSPAFVLTFLSVVVAWVFFRADSIDSALYVLSKMADPDADRVRPRRNRQSRLSSRSMPRSRGSRRTRRRSWATTTPTGPSARRSARGAAASAVPLCHRRGAGVRDSRNPAAQRIHLFQVLMSNAGQKSAAVSRRERARSC